MDSGEAIRADFIGEYVSNYPEAFWARYDFHRCPFPVQEAIFLGGRKHDVPRGIKRSQGFFSGQDLRQKQGRLAESLAVLVAAEDCVF